MENNYVTQTVKNLKEPMACYKEIKVFESGEIEEEFFPHTFQPVDNKITNGKQKVACVECGYEAEFEFEIEDEESSSSNLIDAILPVTPFSLVYDSFLSKITDDMYMELTELDTYRMLEELLLSAMHKFEFPRFDITNYELPYIADEGIYSGIENNGFLGKAITYSGGGWDVILTPEEINIIATYMIVE